MSAEPRYVNDLIGALSTIRNRAIDDQLERGWTGKVQEIHQLADDAIGAYVDERGHVHDDSPHEGTDLCAARLIEDGKAYLCTREAGHAKAATAPGDTGGRGHLWALDPRDGSNRMRGSTS